MRQSPLIIWKSQYTFLEGVHSIPEVVEWGHRMGARALCLADKNGLYGAVDLYCACQEVGIQPLIGTQLVQGPRHVTIIARNQTGYEELSELITRRHLQDFHMEDDSYPESPNLLYICRDLFLLQQWLRGEGPHNKLFLGLVLSNRKFFRLVLNLISRRSDLPRVPAVPVVEVNVLTSSDWALYKVLSAIRLGCTVDTLPAEELSIREGTGADLSFLKDLLTGVNPESIPYRPIISGDHVATLCRLEFDLERYRLPMFTPA
ncbi:MAG: PHP domain-containing protein [Fidelibacterota bacterium]